MFAHINTSSKLSRDKLDVNYDKEKIEKDASSFLVFHSAVFTTKRAVHLSIELDKMDLICCFPNCPPLLSHSYIYSSDDSLHRASNSIFERRLTSYVKRFTRRISFSSSEKDFNEEFEKISLADHPDVSLRFVRLFSSIFLHQNHFLCLEYSRKIR